MSSIKRSTLLTITLMIALLLILVAQVVLVSDVEQISYAEDRGISFEKGTQMLFEGSKSLTTYEVKSISFEYKVTSGETFSVMIGNWEDYFGYFILDANGNGAGSSTSYTGVQAVKLADNYIKLTFNLDDITRTNNAYNRNGVPETIDFVYFRGSDEYTASGLFDNLTYELYDLPQVVDGAAIKLSEPYGIRFKAFVPTHFYDSSAQYGMMIVPYDILTASSIEDNYYSKLNALDISLNYSICSPVAITNSDKHYSSLGDGYVFYSDFVGVRTSDVNRKFVAIAFKLKNSSYEYFELTEAKSIAEIAKIAYEEHRDDYSSYGVETLKSILTTAGYSIDSDGNIVNSVLTTAHVTPYSVDNTAQIKKDASLPSSVEAKVSFAGAKGERETAQLMLYMSQTMNKSYTISFSDLYNGNSVISKDSISSFVQLYINVKTNWSETNNQPSKWYSSSFVETLDTGYYPDGLLPYETAFAKGENIMSTTNGNNQGLFFILNIPSTAIAGTYHGQVSITIEGEGILILPVEIDVFDFVMPENNSKITISISPSQTEYLYGSSHSGYSDSYYVEQFEFLADRGVSGGRTPGSIWDLSQTEAQIKTLKKYAVDDRIAAYYLPLNYTSVSFSVRYKKKSSSISYTTIAVTTPLIQTEDWVNSSGSTCIGMKSLLEKLVNASTNECNLLKKAVVYFPQADEPNDDSDYIQNIICQYELDLSIQYALSACDFTGKSEVKAALEDLGYICTVAPKSQLVSGYNSMSVTKVDDNCQYHGVTKGMSVGTLNGYCPLFTDFYDSSYSSTCTSLIAIEDKTVWWYGCIQPVAPYASYIVNAPMIRARVNRWQQFGLNVEGELYYMANRTTNHIDEEDVQLTETEILQNGIVFNGGYGDGQLLYYVYNTYGDNSSTPKYAKVNYLSTLRLENIAEGNDDYNYLVYAQKLIDSISNTTLKNSYNNRLDAILNTLYSNVLTNTKDSNTFKTARNNLVQIIEELA